MRITALLANKFPRWLEPNQHGVTMARIALLCTFLTLVLLPEHCWASPWQQPPETEVTEDEVALLLKLNKEIKPIEAIEVQGAKRYMCRR